MNPRIVIGEGYSIELRGFARRPVDFHPQPGFMLACILASKSDQAPAGTLIAANPNQPLEIPGQGAGPRAGLEIILVRIDPPLLVETAARLGMHRAGSAISFRATGRPIADARLLAACESMAREIRGGETGWREVVASQVRQLAIYLLRSLLNVERSDRIELSRAGMVDRRLRLAIEFMHDNCARELSLSEIAGAAFLSEFHFSRLFKRITGSSPSTYLSAVRIERARRLLAETDLPITEVGARVGYSSQSHFTKVFRQATGFTPLAWRRLGAKLP